MLFEIFTITFLLSSWVQAHFFIKLPVPIPGSAIKDPLISTGANFPCHGVDLSNPTTRTQMDIGSTQPLEFELGGGANTAVHGGGSCQISITYETDPAKVKDPTNWKVIKSFIGGCPTDALGNLESAILCDGSNAPDCVNDLTFDIPPEVKDGNAILAWTWFNNIGNREMYMNCAAVSFHGGQDQLGTLPNMLVANLGILQCTTTENFNTNFPEPGTYVQEESPLNYPLKPPNGADCSGDGGQLPTAVSFSLSRSTQSTGISKVRISSVISSQGAKSDADSTTGLKTSYTTQVMQSKIQTQCMPCNSAGFFCIDENTFGECSNGCAIPMKVAAGTKCVSGGIEYSEI